MGHIREDKPQRWQKYQWVARSSDGDRKEHLHLAIAIIYSQDCVNSSNKDSKATPVAILEATLCFCRVCSNRA